MELRLGTQVIGDHETAIMATLPCRDDARGGDKDDIAAAAVRAAADGARIVEIGPFPEVVAAVRARLPELVVAVTITPTPAGTTGRGQHQSPEQGTEQARDRAARAAAGAGADLLVGPYALAAVAAEAGIAYAGPDPAAAAALPPERFLLDLGGLPATGEVEGATRTGCPVLVGPYEKGSARVPDPVTVTAVCAWLGARVFRAGDVPATRQALDMVASIGGTRPPAVSRRGLA